MDLAIATQGMVLRPGQAVTSDILARAGLVRVPGWRCLLRRLPAGLRYWEAADPRLSCFDGELDIFACRDSYLDWDRKWGTALLLGERDDRIQWLDIRILEGVYAAGNYYDRFLDSANRRFGRPERNGRRQTIWQTDLLRVEATLSADGLNAVFHVERLAAGCGHADQHDSQAADRTLDVPR